MSGVSFIFVLFVTGRRDEQAYVWAHLLNAGVIKSLDDDLLSG